MAIGRNTNLKRLALLLWALVAVFYFYLSYDYIRVTMSDREFAEYIQHVVQVAGSERRPARDVRDLLLVKAEELSLPVHKDQIVVKTTGINSIDIAVNYAVDIEIPLIQREVYTKRFEHSARYNGPR
jgi:hypothetical protein